MKRSDIEKAVMAALKKEGHSFLAYQVRYAVDCVIENLKSGIKMDGVVTIRGFGKWKCKNKRERNGYDMTNECPAKVSARRVVTFSAGKQLKEAVNVSD